MQRARPSRAATIALALACLLLVGAAFAAHRWPSRPQWTTSDSLFYEANVLRVQGHEKRKALAQVFNGPISSELRRAEAGLPPQRKRIGNPAWVSYSARFYERRWVVPVLAAAVEPAFGLKALSVISLIGYIACGPLFFLLLRRRFETLPSFVGALACQVLLFPVRYWAPFPLTDTFGLALETGALLAGVLVIQRGLRWLPLWVVTLCLLGFTRDAGVIALAGAVWLLLRERNRTSAWLAGTGLLAILPAPLIFRVPLREQLAYVVHGYRIPPSSGWSYVLDRYPGAVAKLARKDFSYLIHHAVTALVVVAGLLLMVGLLSRTRNAADRFLCASAVGALGYLLVLPNYTGFRLELVFVPFVALGLAAGVDAALRYIAPEKVSHAAGLPFV